MRQLIRGAGLGLLALTTAACLWAVKEGAPAWAQSSAPAPPKAGAAGCYGPPMDIAPGVKVCDLDPGKSVRFICNDGRFKDVPAVNGRADLPPAPAGISPCG